MRVVHIGDEHLGGAYPEKAAKSFEFLINQLWEDASSSAFQPDLIISTGDLMDRSLHVKSEHLKPFLDFVKVSKCPVVLLQGTPSHDPIGAIDNIAAMSDGKIITITDPSIIIELPHLDCFVAGLPALTRPQLSEWARHIDPNIDGFDDPDSAVKAILANIGNRWKGHTGPRILTYHGVLRGCTAANGQVLTGGTLEVAREDLALANPHVVLCADIHLAQEWYDPCLVTYCGSSHPCNFGELDQKSFTVIDFNENGKIENFERIPFPHRPMAKVSLAVGPQLITGMTEYKYAEHIEWQVDYGDSLNIDPAGSLSDALKVISETEVKCTYTIPREIAASVDDAYIRVLFAKHGIDLAVVERIIKTESRERIEGITTIQTTAQQYEAVCHARAVEIRPGAIAKCNLMDEQGVAV